MTEEQINALDPSGLTRLTLDQLKVGYVVPLLLGGGGTRAVIVEVTSYGVRFDREWGSIRTCDMFHVTIPLNCWPVVGPVGASRLSAPSLTNFPHHCTRCGRSAYVGLNETDHADEGAAKDCPAPRGRRVA